MSGVAPSQATAGPSSTATSSTTGCLMMRRQPPGLGPQTGNPGMEAAVAHPGSSMPAVHTAGLAVKHRVHCVLKCRGGCSSPRGPNRIRASTPPPPAPTTRWSALSHSLLPALGRLGSKDQRWGAGPQDAVQVVPSWSADHRHTGRRWHLNERARAATLFDQVTRYELIATPQTDSYSTCSSSSTLMAWWRAMYAPAHTVEPGPRFGLVPWAT